MDCAEASGIIVRGLQEVNLMEAFVTACPYILSQKLLNES
jgi:hypothetical protein